MKVLIAGCGYVGLALGAELTGKGHQVWGVRRSEENRAELEQAGILPVVADITRPGSFSALPENSEWVVNCASASGGAAENYRRLYLEGNRNLLTWLASRPPSKFVYTGSTGVYTQNDGSTVDETSQLIPAGGTAQILAETEHLLLDAARASAFPAVILRVAGIYGPGRGYWLQQYLAGTAVMEGAGTRRLNMIHRDDVAAAILVVLERGRPGEIYNAVDDGPPTQLEIFEWLSHRLGRGLPAVRDSTPESLGRRGLTDKIVSNRKLRELGWKPNYPTFREGYEQELRRVFPSRGAKGA